ncbi:MAG TPA: ferredoxin [bacterium]
MMAAKAKPCCGCKYCGIICPESAILLNEKNPVLISENCTDCKLCYFVCPLDCVEEEVFGRRD